MTRELLAKKPVTLAAGLVAALLLTDSLSAAAADKLQNDGAASANPRFENTIQTNKMARGYALSLIARGTTRLENPSGVITNFGLLNDFPPQKVEASKTEPDENTYLVLDHSPGGPQAGFDYGRHFLFQGHENGNDLAYLTRINLDVADPRHRVTLLTPTGPDGKTHLNRIDGSTWNPHTQSLLFTQENGAAGGVVELDLEFGSAPRTLYGSIGQGGFEGIHPDDQGNLLLAEDVGGTKVGIDPNDAASAKVPRNPNSFLYRFVPSSPADLSAGRLQALQLSVDGQPVTFVNVDAAHPFGDVFSPAQKKLHTAGTSWPVRWVTVHDTAIDGVAAFDANALAKAKGATPFKRPENLVFLPGSSFRTFFFAATGDTDAVAGNRREAAERGAWGALFRVDLAVDRNTGTLSLVALGDSDHAAFDNLAFASDRILLTSEDRGDSLHKQLGRLDSVWAYDVSDSSRAPVRLLALGRDDQSTVDARYLDAATSGYQNDGDNEPTGLFVSDGDPSLSGLLGGPLPSGASRWFVTQQHGRNRVFEVSGPKDLEKLFR